MARVSWPAFASAEPQPWHSMVGMDREGHTCTITGARTYR